MNLKIFDQGLTRLAGAKSLLLKKSSPEILMAIGITGIVSSTVLACRATLKSEAIIDGAKKQLNTVNVCWEDVQQGKFPAENYTDKDHKKDLTTVYAQTAIKFVRLYGPSVTIGAVSIGCIVGAHGMLQKRNVALMAAYKTIDEGFRSYRKRVVDEYGEEQDFIFRHGLRAETVIEEEVDDTGKVKKVKKKKYSVDPNATSIYARFFDDSCTQWSKTPEYNLMFLRAQQNYYNDMLKVRGHVFLNEVYDALGIQRTSAGSVVGWMIGAGDDYIDFGIYDGQREKQRDFVNGYEQTILLDFNVDGVIYDII